MKTKGAGYIVWKSIMTHRAQIIIRYLYVDVNHIPKVETTMQHSTAKCNWGKATESQLSEYTTHCETLLSSDVSLDCEAIYCTYTACSDPNHKHSIETL